MQQVSSGSRGAKGAMAPPGPVKIGHKKDGCQRRPHRFHVSWPPLTQLLDPLLSQECIPVGCVPSAAVAVCLGGCLLPGVCLPGLVSWCLPLGVCLPGVGSSWCLPGGVFLGVSSWCLPGGVSDPLHAGKPPREQNDRQV